MADEMTAKPQLSNGSFYMTHLYRWLPLLVVFFFIGYFYSDTFLYLFTQWSQYQVGGYDHGFLVVLISLYLLYDKRQQLFSVPLKGSYVGLFFVLATSFLWTVGNVSDVLVVQACSLLLILLAVVWAVCGFACLRVVAFPILYLIFAVPMWSFLSPPLQVLVADVVYPALRWLDIPALRDQHIIILPAGEFLIEETCSGLRYLLAALNLSVLYAYLNYTRFSARLLVVVIAAGTAIIANIIRVFIIIYMGHITDMQHPLVQDHLNFGWILFGVLIFLLLVIDILWHKKRARSAASSVVQKQNKILEKKGVDRDCTEQPHLRTSILITGVVVLFSAIGPLLSYQVHKNSVESEAVKVNVELPIVGNGWLLGTWDGDNWKPRFHGAVEALGDYQKAGQVLRLYVGYYPFQGQDKEMINEDNSLGDGQVWFPVYAQAQPVLSGKSDFLEQIVKSSQGIRRLVWYRYYIGGRLTTNPYIAKLFQVWGVFSGDRQAAVVVMGTPIMDNNIEVSRATLVAFSKAVQWDDVAKNQLKE
ncbi:MAG: EpsI family protein [Gammaproteobacteria bacterium]|nr:EpsI family protein [Gammaproteobacteria bacterium]